MKYQLNVYGSPLGSNAAREALQFAQLCLNRNHIVVRCFFYFDAVYTGLSAQSPSSDELDLLAGWQGLAANNIPLFLCIAAATNRGVMDETEAQRYEQPMATADRCFELTGLGQWASGFVDADRIITFK
ncbi:sulfurtransferase complex subunit TusD [Reinekea marinisedimentorum]|uniref:tRNA 2-thiouridine synthesizing protein D n=1 Tax=Reinekea marinisedimentorum TaxID=230495 RepID=A0A4R3ICY3_9GAMM|nr:sulfurtransferase complex subunit TusD [Reinekea marinisedimentorum]TCS42495.1 tRNA 2-thiouridine synthesizing protein D [Reinekea marinisedimentorum]